MHKRLNSYFPDALEGNGIFTAISQISWFPNVVPAHVDTYFMLKHGDKLASKVLDKFADEDGHVTGAKLNTLANVIHNAYITNWEHEYKTLTVEYNPIENTDFVETIQDKSHKENEGSNVTTGKITNSNDNVTTGSFENSNVTTGTFENSNVTTGKVSNVDVTTGKMSTSGEVNVAGFDSASTVPSSDTASSTDYTGDGTDPMTVTKNTDYTGDGTDPMTVTNTTDYDSASPLTVTNTVDYGDENSDPLTVSSTATTDYGTKTGTPLTVDNNGSEDGTYERELRKHGNIGVTTNAQMIDSDLDVWQMNNFYDILSKDICKVIALSIY